MKKIAFVLILCAFGALNAYSQETTLAPAPTPIEKKGSDYYQHGKKLTDNELFDLLKTDRSKEARRNMKVGYPLKKTGKILIIAGIPIGVVGAGLIAGGILQTRSERGRDGNGEALGIAMIGVGAVTTAVGMAATVTGVVLKCVAKRRISHAVDVYNKNLSK